MLNNRDFFGAELRVGDEIVYPGRQGSSMWLNNAKIVGLKTKKSIWDKNAEYLVLECVRWDNKTCDYTGKKVVVSNINNVVLMWRKP